MSVVTVSFAAEHKKSIPLVKVYCSFILSEKNLVSSDEVSLGTFDERWNIFMSYLKNRELFVSLNQTSDETNELTECIQAHRETFEMGEFILAGLDSVAESANLLAKSEEAPLLITSNMNLLDREISTPDMEVVYGLLSEESDLQSGNEVSKQVLQSGISERSQRYQTLWSEFTLKLHDSYIASQASLPVLTSETR